MRIGFIGMGQMGTGMATSLLKAGHQVIVFNRTRSRAEALQSVGAKVAQAIAEACDTDAVFTMLADDQAVEELVFGEGGVLATLRPQAIHISSSTISVALSERMDEAHRAVAQRYVSAPVLGRPDRAKAGELFIIAAGAADALSDAQILFDAIGQRTISFGAPASRANLVKLSANFLLATVIESLGEALALVDRAGVDREHYVDFLTSTLFGSLAYKSYGPLVAAREEPPVGFAAPLGFKDVRLALAAAETLGVSMPIGTVLHDRFVELLADGNEDRDWSALGRMAYRHRGETSAR